MVGTSNFALVGVEKTSPNSKTMSNKKMGKKAKQYVPKSNEVNSDVFSTGQYRGHRISTVVSIFKMRGAY